MISVSDQITLQTIQETDQVALYELMLRIYPPAYHHFWKDDCSWYLNTLYSIDNVKKELQQEGGNYFFVRFRKSVTHPYQTIGIFKTIENHTYPPLKQYKAFKIHRIYLDPIIQGHGIGKKLMRFAEKEALKTDHKLIWLDAMDKHKQAQGFYKTLGYQKTILQQLDLKLLHKEYRPMWYQHKMLT